ncbi:MAG: hypothetical protein H0X01_07215, partial [Nitrospira sp.]|nr:hypothetical protein [Nitrospira sp.]
MSTEVPDFHKSPEEADFPVPTATPEKVGASVRLRHIAIPLIGSDALLQGARYVFLLYLGYQSLSVLGSFLMGAALGSLLGVAVDFGISQHWLRLGVKEAFLTHRTFTRVIQGKITFSVLGLVLLVLLAIGGMWNVATPLAMAIGALLMTLQTLGDTCEAVALSLRRYATVSRFRVLSGLGMYGLPLICGVLLNDGNALGGFFVALVTAATAGVVLSSFYMWKMAEALRGEVPWGVGYREAWWDARWLGLNQLAVVVDVRAPLIILGVMLGDTAVGLYGLVQRTTAVAELAWASISRLLLTSYSELAGEKDLQKLRIHVIHAARLTALIMAGAVICTWTAVFVVTRLTEFSRDTALALSL